MRHCGVLLRIDTEKFSGGCAIAKINPLFAAQSCALAKNNYFARGAH